MQGSRHGRTVRRGSRTTSRGARARASSTPFRGSRAASARRPRSGSRKRDVDLTGEHVFARTYVPMLACLLIPGFELRAALRARPGLAVRPAALAPAAGAEPLVGPVTAAAEAAGVRPGMRLSEALASCPRLVLVEQDPAAAEQAWEGILRRLEDVGLSVDSGGLGCEFSEAVGNELTLRRAFNALLERVLARPEREGRFVRKLAVSACLVGGGSWR